MSRKGLNVGYEVDYEAGVKAGCSSRIIIADRIFYVKLFSDEPSRFYSGDQKGVIQKEISKAEFELWVTILAESETEAALALKKLGLGKKY